jgi:hypothetical protein
MKILNISIIGVNYVIPANETTLQQYVATYGPISVAIDASLPSFNSYSGGIYSEPSCGKNINHAVNVVGYGSNGTGNDYWIGRPNIFFLEEFYWGASHFKSRHVSV